jgi:hypothetical protein
MSSFIKIPSLGGELFHTGGRTDRQTDCFPHLEFVWQSTKRKLIGDTSMEVSGMRT